MRQFKITKKTTDRSGISLDKYLQDIDKIPILTADEEVSLARRIKTGDQQALEILVTSNLRFVVSVAKQYLHQGLQLPDLINEGNLGLIKAATRFDETRGFKFISYAVWWIRQAILMALNEHAKVVRLPLNVLSRTQKIWKAIELLEQQFEREPTQEEIVECLKTTPDELKKYIDYVGKQSVSLDAPLTTTDNDELTFLDVLPGTLATDARCETEDLRTEIKRTLNILKKQEREIVELYFGLNGHRPLSLSEIAEQLSYTTERIRQLKEKALRKIRRSSNNKNLRTYL